MSNAKDVIGVLSRLFGVGAGTDEEIDKHADHTAIYDAKSRGLDAEKARRDSSVAVEPCKSADDWRQCLADALIRNDKLSAKRFLVTLGRELTREEPKEKPRRR